MILIGRSDTEAETPIFWPLDVNNWLTRKDLDDGKDWRQEEKGTTEDKIVGWHHWLNGHESEYAPGVGDGQGSLGCCSPWGLKESDMTERLNSKSNIAKGFSVVSDAEVHAFFPNPCISSDLKTSVNSFMMTSAPGDCWKGFVK